jgi:hypothetical protein
MFPQNWQQAAARSTVDQLSSYRQGLHDLIAHRFRRSKVREHLPCYLLGLLGEAATARKLERPGEESRLMRFCMSDTPAGKCLQRSPNPPCG